jgi:hypothetical protein
MGKGTGREIGNMKLIAVSPEDEVEEGVKEGAEGGGRKGATGCQS